MKNIIKRSILVVLAFCMLFQNGNVACAATKTVQAIKCNKYTGTADTTAFYNGVLGISGYSGANLGPTGGTLANFRNNTRTIKYWSSHGSNGGSVSGTPIVYGDGSGYTGGNISSAANASYWKGGELEFVILAACRQLDGSGANPRSTYAKAMTGSTKNLRVIAGYHEGAPKSPGDKSVVDKLMPLLKSGESLKSSWITANTSVSWNTYCVLTHNNSSQYSRFPGFSTTTYSRPTGTSILRFSSVNPGGTTQTYSAINAVALSNGLITDTSLSTKQAIPAYALRAIPREVEIEETAPVMVYRNEDTVTVSCNEIGDSVVDFDVDEAMTRSKEWLDSMVTGIGSSDLDAYEISPLVMAEVNLDGGPEVEETIAYTIRFFNTYDGIKVEDNGYVAIVDNDGINTAVMNWADFEQVNMDSTPIDLNEALNLLGDEIQSTSRSLNQLSVADRTIKDTELVFSYDEASELFQPSWKINMQNGNDYTVNCMTGEIEE